MYAIELMKNEHENILLLCGRLQKIACGIVEGGGVDAEGLCGCIDFAKNYGDKHHHGKEEQILFRVMVEKLGAAAQSMVKNGMLVEHNLGRFHVAELENALASWREKPDSLAKARIIAHALGYAETLASHIQKENNVCYVYAERNLCEDDKRRIDDEVRSFEAAAERAGVQAKYSACLEGNA